jgi:hypothetical protein
MKIPPERLATLARKAAERLADLAGEALEREVASIMRATEAEHEHWRSKSAPKRRTK